MKILGAILIMTATTGMHANASAPDSMTKLEKAFPPVEIFDHSKALLTKTGQFSPDVMQATTVPVSGMPFDQCLQLDLKQPGTSPYAVNFQFFEPNHWQVGDTGIIAFYCRTLRTENSYGASSLKIQYKPSYKDWRGHKETDLYLTKDWKLVMIPFEVKIAAPDTPESVLSFFLGGVDPHAFQMANLRVYRYGNTFSLKELPLSKAYYPGMEPDAPWRKDAADRIEKHRKADLQLTISGQDGKPLQGARVHLQLKRHKFGFGAAVHTPLLVSPDVPEDERKQYSDILTRTCSKITPTNAMKWRLYDHFKEHVPALIDWCSKHDMTLRGHLFIWPGFERLPNGYDLYKTDPDAFRKDLTDHIEEFANLYPDAFSEWDVMNEPYTEHDYMDLLGKDVVLEWFETARKANPDYLTYINDYGILSDNNAEHRDNYFDWISYLVENNAPLDGIGFQGHFKTAMPPELIQERIDRYAAFGKKMQITEFDFDHTDTELQARFFEDFITLIYSHPQMSALINWIYLEDNFRPNAAVYRKDFTPTAMGKVWERLLTQQWHTEKTLTTDANGEVNLRGFKGMYSIRIEHAGTTVERVIELTEDAHKTMSLPSSR
jgi:GH35 family endo-1,4-beta-xylanase